MPTRHPLATALPLLLALTGSLSGQQVADTAFRTVVGTPAFPAGQGPLVLVDAAHHNFHTAAGRYLPFAALLRRDGFRVRDSDAPFTAAALAGVRMLVIANAVSAADEYRWIAPIASAFTTDEIAAVRQWVAGGGSLLLIADHMPFGEATAALAEAFGITMLGGFAIDSATERNGNFDFHRADATLADHPISRGRTRSERIDSVRSFTGQLFRIASGTPLLRAPGAVTVVHPDTAWQFSPGSGRESGRGALQGAAIEVGRGRVAVFGEAAMFSAQLAGPNRVPVGMNQPAAPQNAPFLLNVVHWLAGAIG